MLVRRPRGGGVIGGFEWIVRYQKQISKCQMAILRLSLTSPCFFVSVFCFLSSLVSRPSLSLALALAREILRAWSSTCSTFLVYCELLSVMGSCV